MRTFNISIAVCRLLSDYRSYTSIRGFGAQTRFSAKWVLRSPQNVVPEGRPWYLSPILPQEAVGFVMVDNLERVAMSRLWPSGISGHAKKCQDATVSVARSEGAH